MNYKILVITLLAFAFIACNKKDLAEPKPTPPSYPKQVRGFMVHKVEEINHNTINAAAEWGVNVIRIQLFPVKYAERKNMDIWTALPSYLSLLDERIQWAKAKNIKVVIDLHQAPVHNSGMEWAKAFWDNPEVEPHFIRIWKEIATKFKDSSYNDVIWGYDIYNEPAEKVPQTAHIPYRWRKMAPDVIAAIRAIDNDVWVIYEPGPWGDPIGYKDLTPLADKKVIYSIHFYNPFHFTHQGVFLPENVKTKKEAKTFIGNKYPGTVKNKYWDKKQLEQEIQYIDAFRKKYNVPVFVGEFSVVRWAPTSSATRWLNDVISLFEERNWSWCYHAFREWHGWDLEYKEGTDEFWFKGEDPYPERSKIETQRAKVLKKALQKNK